MSLVMWILLGVLAGPGQSEAPPANRCAEVEGAGNQSETAPVPLPSNPMPRYPALLLDAGIGDTIVVRFVVGRDGTVQPSTYCVERQSGYAGLTAAAIKEWRFSPARHGGVTVPANYRLVVVFTPVDTVRGPIAGARVLGETHQPLLSTRRPHLLIGPMRRTFGVRRVGTVGEVSRSLRDTLVNSAVDLIGKSGLPRLCVQTATGGNLEWDIDSRTAKGAVMPGCPLASRTLPYTILRIAADDVRAGRYEGGVLRVPVLVRTHDYSHCRPTAFMCGGGRTVVLDCEVVAPDEDVQCAIASDRMWVS